MSILRDIWNVLVAWNKEMLGTANVDANAILTKRAAQNPEHLDWQNSIVDLLKLLNLDSSLEARAHLANELGFSGTYTGTADENIWLHNKVMQRITAGQM
jgi:hypothetical protein